VDGMVGKICVSKGTVSRDTVLLIFFDMNAQTSSNFFSFVEKADQGQNIYGICLNEPSLLKVLN
jgi:hypothetical protein